jgi:hypothetical protein
MPLYHFTAAHCLRQILEQGLTHGHTPVIINRPGVPRRMAFISGTQWMTTDKSFIQDWHAPIGVHHLPYDRNAFRLTLEIPNAQRSHTFTWDDFYKTHMKPRGFEKLARFDDKRFCNPDLWRIFVGNVHPLWIKNFLENPGGYRSCFSDETAAT